MADDDDQISVAKQLREAFYELFSSIESSVETACEDSMVTIDAVQSASMRLEFLIVYVVRILHLLPSVAEDVLDCTRRALGCLEQVLENSSAAVGSAYTARSSGPARRRPKFDISREQLEHFIETGF